MPDRRPHILIFMPDQWRADALGCAGHPLVKTPHVDRLAAEGMRFTQAFTVSPLCIPARSSFVSGLYPHNHHIWSNAGSLPADDETFFHHLQAAGYYTAHIGKSHYYSHQAGDHLRHHEGYMHARGLDHVHETTGPWATLLTDSYMTDRWQEEGFLIAYRDDYWKRKEIGARAVWPSPLPVHLFLDSYIGQTAVSFVESYGGRQPLCLFVGFGGPHEPWDAPGEYATMYDPAAVPPPIPPEEPGDWLPVAARQRMVEGRKGDLSEMDIRRIRASYYGKITLVDRWIGEILAAFERRGWLEDTLVVFWSDHGEMAGDHGRLFKSVFYNSSVQVPLVIRWPGHIPAGVMSSAFVEIIDVYPTLLEAVGAAPSQRCFGRSLWPVLRDPAQLHRDAVLSEIWHDGHYCYMIRTERYKYALDETDAGYMFHDVREDPLEQRNLAGHPMMQEVEAELRARLLSLLIGTQYRLY